MSISESEKAAASGGEKMGGKEVAGDAGKSILTRH